MERESCFYSPHGCLCNNRSPREKTSLSLRRLIAAEMGRIHAIQPKCGPPVEPFLWTKMSHFLTLAQSGFSSGRTKRYDTPSMCVGMPEVGGGGLQMGRPPPLSPFGVSKWAEGGGGSKRAKKK